MTQNKNDSINSILQHGRGNNCCVVFPTSRSPYLILCRRQCKWKIATTYYNLPIFEPARKHHFGPKVQNFENPIITFGCFSLKAVNNSWKLQRLLQVAKFLVMCSFTTLLFRHLPTEIIIFINVCYQMKRFSDDSFSFFFRSRFYLYSTYIFDFM